MSELFLGFLLTAFLIWFAVFQPSVHRWWKGMKLRHAFFHASGGYDLLWLGFIVLAMVMICFTVHWGVHRYELQKAEESAKDWSKRQAERLQQKAEQQRENERGPM